MTRRLHRFRRAVPATALALSWLLAWALCAEDWPQWRGPNRDAVWNETNVLQTFPTNGLKVHWRASVGLGFSSPVVAQGRVYVSDARLARPKVIERVLCFDEATGQSLWTNSHDATFPDWAFVPGQETVPNGTPIVRDGKVYAPGANGHRLFCLEASTGRLLWQKDLAKGYQIEKTTSISTSPLIDGDRLIHLIGGKPGAGVIAFDRNSGKELWKSLDEPAAHSSPILITAGGARQLIVWTLQSVTSLDSATGKPYWRERFTSASSSVVSTPVYSNNRLLVSGLMLKLDGDKPSAMVLWPKTPMRRVLTSTSTPLLRDEHVFLAESSGELVCRDAATGQQLWKTNRVTDPGNSASIHITVNGDSVLLFNDRGELIRARLTAQSYHEISRVKLVDPGGPFGGRKVAWAAPAFANRHVFARTDKELISASLETEQ